MSIKESEKISYQFFPAIDEDYEDDKLILSVLIDCYFNLDYVKKSVQSILDQDYQNVELVLIDNYSSNDISIFLKTIYEENKNTILIKYDENQFSWNDTEKNIAICWNAGLIRSKGEIVSHLAYDDQLSRNYASSMTKLFFDNPNCMTAAPLPVSIDMDGNINDEKSFVTTNNRPRYINGKKLALDFINGSPQGLISAPGEIFAIRREILMKFGGFERGFDLNQILKYAIHGDSGFDQNSYLYWRHHDNQVNRLSKNKGHVHVSYLKKIIINSNIIEIWSNKFDKKEVTLLKQFFKRKKQNNPALMAIEMVFRKNIYGLILVYFNTAREAPFLLPRTILLSLLSVFKIIFNKFSRAFLPK